MSKAMAWVEDGIVENLVMMNPDQTTDFEAPGREIVDTRALDVRIGDTWDGVDFWRDGEKLVDMTAGPTNPPAPELPEDAQEALERLGVEVYEKVEE